MLESLWRALRLALALGWMALMAYCAVVYFRDGEWAMFVTALAFGSAPLWVHRS